MLLRRELLNTALAAGAASLLTGERSLAAPPDAPVGGMIDTNVHLFHWPFRRLPLDETPLLVTKLRSLGFSQAWAGSFEGILHRDVAGVNARLVQACQPYPELQPVGTINLELPGWQTDFERCRDQFAMRHIRLYPNYHGYTLADARFTDLLRQAAVAGMLVQIAVSLEDVRTQHPLVQTADVDWGPVPDLLHKVPGARIQLLNAKLQNTQLIKIAQVPGLSVDTARSEGIDGVANLVRRLPPGRVNFGSHAPFFIPESALIRVSEATLTPAETEQLMRTNALAFVS
jgi:predicted TIM-barrel fold metal-dependent hydrolase